jgi:type VI protein secretion system component Hcp
VECHVQTIDRGPEPLLTVLACKTQEGSHEFFVADSFSFGVEREMKESGEKGGTADINIGVGELQECTLERPMATAPGQLARSATNGNSSGTAEIDFVEVAGKSGGAAAYLRYKLDRAFIKSWSTSGDADDRPTEEVAFYYNKIAFRYDPHAVDLAIAEETGSQDVRV